MSYLRDYGQCRRCGRTVPLTTQGKLFLHGDRTPIWKPKATVPDLGEHCSGGMTRDYEPATRARERKTA